MPPQMPRPKILCLHGYLQNGRVLAEKTSGLRKHLTKKLNYQLDYVDAPVMVDLPALIPFPLAPTPEEAKSKWDYIVEKGVNRSWYRAFNEEGSQFYYGFRKLLEHLANHIKEHGPYHGVIGFSQGAAMSFMLNNCIQELVPGHPPFKLLLLVSGFAFTNPVDPAQDIEHLNQTVSDLAEYSTQVKINEVYADYLQFKGDPRVIFVYGTADQVVPEVRSKYLASLVPAKNVVQFQHDGGHYFPNKKDFLLPIISEFEGVFAGPNL